MHVLVWRTGAVGDVILTLPAMRALRRRYPAARISALGSPERWSLIPGVDDRWDADHPLFAGLYDRPSPELRRLLQDVDLAIAWTVRPPRGLETLGIPTIHASPYPPPDLHAADWLIHSLGEHADPRPGDHLLHPYRSGHTIYLHPGAGAPWKRWPAARFAALATRLPAAPAVIEGPADAAAVDAVLQRISLPILREPSLPHLADRLSDAALFVGNDSGITHLAAALGIPTIALFGPTDPAGWAPRGNVRILRRCTESTREQGQIRVCPGDCLEATTVDDVLAAAAEMGERMDAKAAVDKPVEKLSREAPRR